MNFSILAPIVLLAVSSITIVAPDSQAAKKAPELCPVGTSQGPSHPHCIPKLWDTSVAEVQVPEGCRLVVGTDVFECPDRPQRGSRHVPSGRRAAPTKTQGAGTRKDSIALSIPRPSGQEVPTAGPKRDPRGPVKFAIGLVA
jgi:hypothetical protein